MSRAQEGSGRFPTHEDQGAWASSVWEQKPGLWASEETGARGRRTQGAEQPLGTLTFVDDPVEDGLQLLDTDLQVLGGKGGWHPPWEEAAPDAQRPPPSRPNLPPLPAV